MNLEYITQYIDKKIDENEEIVVVTFYELRLKEGLSKEDMCFFVKLSKQRLLNIGYEVYETGEKYRYHDKEDVVKSNVVLLAIKRRK